MPIFGQLCLLIALVSAGYAAFACLWGGLRESPRLVRSGLSAAVGGTIALTCVVAVLSWALLTRDFRFAYVAEYSSRSLPWQYSLAALWVGQAGSLLLWAWLLNAMALVFRFWPWQERHFLREPALGIVMGYLCFLIMIMVFAADPMQVLHSSPREGGGLSPLLQHPSMLIHPPIVFAGYAAWTFPFALAAAALLSGKLDASWVRLARPWALVAWSVLGIGILLGAQWAYQELGWGGYWSWDPVENGSLIPWLTGTALIHGLMCWQHCNMLKKTSLSLAIATFGLCNFATFLTRSGVFSSVHAFSQSAIGWMFLALMLVLTVGAVVLIAARRRELMAASGPMALLSRATLVIVSIALLMILTVVVIGGTLMGALSTFTIGRTILIGPPFYNNVLLPVGLLLLAMTAGAPLLRWRLPPAAGQGKLITVVVLASLPVPVMAYLAGMRQPMTLVVIALAALVVASFGGSLWRAVILPVAKTNRSSLQTLAKNRRQYAGFVIHVGLALLAVGVAGSSFGTRRHEAVMKEGEVVQWAGRDIRYARLIQHTRPDVLVAAAELQIEQSGKRVATLLPARHLYRLQNEWTTEVAIHSTWQADFYVILHTGEGGGRITLSFIENPLMRWIWVGAGVMACGAIVAMWPTRKRTTRRVALPGPADVGREPSHRKAA